MVMKGNNTYTGITRSLKNRLRYREMDDDDECNELL